MTRYQIQEGNLTLDVREEIRDLEVIFTDGIATELQVWVRQSVSIGDQVIRTSPAACHVMRMTAPDADSPAPGDEPFGPTGISLAQAMTVLAVLGAGRSGLPTNVIDGTVVRPELPADIGATIAALEDRKASLQAETEALLSSQRRAQDDLARINDCLRQTVAETSERKTDFEQQAAGYQGQLAELKHDLTELQVILQDRRETVDRLDQVIQSKSEQSTAATAELDQLQRTLGLTERLEELPSLLQAAEARLTAAEVSLIRRQEELAALTRTRLAEIDALDAKIQARKSDPVLTST